MSSLFHMCIVFGVLVGIGHTGSSAKCKLLQYRSTKTFRTLFVGKCLHYQSFVNKEPFCSRPTNCDSLWKLFLGAFAHQPICDVSPGRYIRFFRAASYATKRNKQIFWSGLYEFTKRYTNGGKNFFAVADTLAGYLVDGVDNWCGSTSSKDGNEADLKLCPPPGNDPNCLNSATSSFWARASIEFAQMARGNIQIMLSANRSPVFSHTTYFYLYELPNINSKNVKHASIVLVNQLGTQPSEKCNGDSVMELRKILKKKGISSDCEINPRDVMFTLCADSPDAKECDTF